MRQYFFIGIILLASVAGCASSGAKAPKSATQKELAKKEWDDTRAHVLYGLAKEQYESGNFDKCRQTLNDALRMQPKDAPLRCLSGKLAIEQGQLELAETELKLAREADPKSADANFLSGVIYQRWQKPEVAFDFYSKASALAPAELGYIMAKSEMLVAMNRADEALAMLREKVTYFEHSAAIRDAVGQILMQKGQYVEAIPFLQEAAMLSNDDPSTREHLGLALYCGQQYAPAADVLSRLTKDPKFSQRSDLLLALGESRIQLHQPREARDAFDAATQASPESSAAWTSLTKAAIQCNDPTRAEMSLKTAIALEAPLGETSLLQGYLRLKQNRLDEALAAFRQSSAAQPADSVSLCMIGLVLEKQGQSEEAMTYYSRALKLKPDDELAMKLMAQVDPRE